ncbi:MAG TPA: sulfatase-like hydrolase/transferase, partial [Thermoanaerobaculia bacterium]|nr:sulfatase-like hydrolase/transferase [Thermoanaerobaculia bacterium]
HGVRDNMGYQFEAGDHFWLPSRLRERGYRTGAAVSAFVLRGTAGIAEGFEVYEDEIRQTSIHQPASVQRRGGETLARIRDWLDEVAGEPFLLFFHIYEPHRPLAAPEPFRSRYPSAYDAEVAAADAVVGDLLDRLRDLGVYERAIVLFVSDHGEGLGDHGLEEHGPLLYREQLQVPLLLKLPGSERGGRTVSAPAQLVDLAPTLLELLGLEVPPELPGTSLLALESPAALERPIFAETFFPRLHFGWSELASVIDWPHHYIHGPDPELYDLESDPEELRNVLREDRRAYAATRDALRGYDFEYRPPSAAVDPEIRARLAALGYLGSVAGEREGPLADPKAKLPVLRRLGSAVEQFRSGRFSAAVPLFREVLGEEPGLLDGWEYLGHSLMRLGRPAEALEAYERLLTASAGSPQAALGAAGALLELGRLDEAVEHAELAVELLPVDAHDQLAQIHLRRGDLEAAERHAERAVARRGARLGPLITRAHVALDRRQPERALELTDRALADLAPEVDTEIYRGLFLVRGQALAELGRSEEAARALAREIELFPEELAPYSRLALLHALVGDGRRAGAALQRMVEANPRPEAYAEAAQTMRVLGDPAAAERLLREARRRWPESPVLRQPAG